MPPTVRASQAFYNRALANSKFIQMKVKDGALTMQELRNLAMDLGHSSNGSRLDYLIILSDAISKNRIVLDTSVTINWKSNILNSPPKPAPAPVVPKPAANRPLSINSPIPITRSPFKPLEIKLDAKANKRVTQVTKLADKDATKVESRPNPMYTASAFIDRAKTEKFIYQALEAEGEYLFYKYKQYERLSKLKWETDDVTIPNKLATIKEIIKARFLEIKAALLSPNSNDAMRVFATKRAQLMGIVHDKDYGLSSIKGKSRDALKTEILKFVFTFIQLPKFFMNNFLNIMLLGPAGSGKSKVGGVLSHVFYRLGINTTHNVTMATPQNLVGQFVGQSAPKTRKVLVENLEGVLFIDEAYTLTPCPGAGPSDNKAAQFNEEAMGELINFMDKFIGCIVVIVAGYENKMMNCFLPFNEGLSRRFPRVMKLTPYSAEDLVIIMKSFLEETGPIHEYLSKSQLAYIAQLIEDTNAHDIYTNQAGDMLNLSKALLEDAIMYQQEYDADAIFQTFVRFAASKRFKLA